MSARQRSSRIPGVTRRRGSHSLISRPLFANRQRRKGADMAAKPHPHAQPSGFSAAVGSILRVDHPPGALAIWLVPRSVLDTAPLERRSWETTALLRLASQRVRAASRMSAQSRRALERRLGRTLERFDLLRARRRARATAASERALSERPWIITRTEARLQAGLSRGDPQQAPAGEATSADCRNESGARRPGKPAAESPET